jgi:hypothetical protein
VPVMSYVQRSGAASAPLQAYVGYSICLDSAARLTSCVGSARSVIRRGRDRAATDADSQRGHPQRKYVMVAISRQDRELHLRRGRCRTPDCKHHVELWAAGSAP